MQFKVKDIGDDGLEVDLPLTAAWLTREVADADLTPAKEGLHFKGRIDQNGEDYLFRGKLAGDLVMPCARCLEPAQVPVDVDVAVIFVEHFEDAKAKAKGKDDEDEDDTLDSPDVVAFKDGVIDVTAELRDQILLALPPSPRCREDCAGLCPVCGGNRNLSPCACVEQQKMQQSKLSALGKLKI